MTFRRLSPNRSFGMVLAAILVTMFSAGVVARAAPSLGTYEDKFRGAWVAGKHGVLPYHIFAPPKADLSDPLPVVIHLHGSGQSGKNYDGQIRTAAARSFVRFFPKRPCILIAPASGAATGNWLGPAGDAVIGLLEDVLNEVSVADANRVYLTGYSFGGMGTWHLLAKKPGLFAAAIPVAGAGKPETAARLKGIDIWIFHGARDTAMPVKYGRMMAEALQRAGAPAKYTEWKSSGHGIAGKAFGREETHEWLFRQRRN